MKILRGGSENFYTPEGGLWKNCWARLLARRGARLRRLIAKKKIWQSESLTMKQRSRIIPRTQKRKKKTKTRNQRNEKKNSEERREDSAYPRLGQKTSMKSLGGWRQRCKLKLTNPPDLRVDQNLILLELDSGVNSNPSTCLAIQGVIITITTSSNVIGNCCILL